MNIQDFPCCRRIADKLAKLQPWPELWQWTLGRWARSRRHRVVHLFLENLQEGTVSLDVFVEGAAA